MYAFRKIIVPQSKYSIKCPYSMTAEYITIHNTYNDASALNEVTYHNSNNNQVSFHFAVDDKEIIQCVEVDRIAWHAGDGGNGKGNRKSIGIEICYSKSGGERYVKAEENAVLFTAQLLFERGWGVDRVKQHYDWSKKNCPHRIRDEKRWDSFVSRIKKELDKLKQPVNPTPPTTNQGGSPILKLAKWQVDEMESLFKTAREKGFFTSADWEKQVREGKLTQDDALYLLGAIINRVHFKK